MTSTRSVADSSLSSGTSMPPKNTAQTTSRNRNKVTSEPPSSSSIMKNLFLPKAVTIPKPSGKPNNNPAVAATSHTPPPPPPEVGHRAVHRIRLSALEHNFACVEQAANQQRCSVITVVKADGYGHGAVATALHLADCCGAGAFAVATLEEAIHLRRAFENNPPGRWSKQLASHFHVAHNSSHPAAWAASATVAASSSAAESAVTSHSREQQVVANAAAQSIRPAHIRILVLGPPVGFPRCFDDYYYHNIEVMVSGPEVAASLLAWVADEKERKRTQVERAASEAKAQALLKPLLPRDAAAAAAAPSIATAKSQIHPSQQQQQQRQTMPVKQQQVCGGNSSHHSGLSNGSSNCEKSNGSSDVGQESTGGGRKILRHPSSTLGNVSGADLVKEVRALLMNQRAAEDASNFEKELQQQQRNSLSASAVTSRATSTVSSADNSVSSDDSSSGVKQIPGPISSAVVAMAAQPAPKGNFAGIEAIAKDSRARELAVHQRQQVFQEDSHTETTKTSIVTAGTVSLTTASSTATAYATTAAATVTPAQPPPLPGAARKRLRWHALVDSGMGRLGFKTDIPKPGEARRNTVDVIKEMVDAEIIGNAPIEFFGMCTHMADASSTSDYTNSQISRFVSLLKRVRAAGISVPTVSTDNSAALLTTNLQHFDPDQILSQPGADSRGFVRVGGAIYGQRPAFPQLKAVSALTAAVRHVAILKKGETVGYDRAYVANHDVRIATLTIGFADGYPRLLGNGVGRVEIRGKVFPVAGNVCMDMLMVDLGPAEDTKGVGASVAVGDTAVLWGPLEDDDGQGQVRLQDLAAELKTTQSALTCGLDKIRVRRHFL